MAEPDMKTGSERLRNTHSWLEDILTRGLNRSSQGSSIINNANVHVDGHVFCDMH